MIKNPKILVYDELIGALDIHSSKSVLEVVETLNQQYHTTILIITHNVEIATMANQIIHIKDGKIYKSEVNMHKLPVAQIEL